MVRGSSAVLRTCLGSGCHRGKRCCLSLQTRPAFAPGSHLECFARQRACAALLTTERTSACLLRNAGVTHGRYGEPWDIGSDLQLVGLIVLVFGDAHTHAPRAETPRDTHRAHVQRREWTPACACA
eukprot:6190871-Pleurochrysis_carterae.AAC.5